MKKILFILLIGFSFSQSTSLALYGVGEKNGSTDISSIALGNSIFFSGNKHNISNDSPSSLWRSALTRFSIRLGMNYLTNSQIPISKHYEHALTFFSLSFPVGNKKVVGLGMQPAFHTNKIVIQQSKGSANLSGTSFEFKNSYIIDGGISKVFMQYSQKLGSNFSIGLQYSLLFGNQVVDYDYYIYKINSELYESKTDVTKYHKFSGSEILIEGRYAKHKQEFAARIGFNGKTKVQTQIKQFSDYLSNNISRAKLSEIFIGYQYKIADHLGILSEFHLNYPFNIPDAVALFKTMPPKETSIHFGTYYQYVNPKIGFWNNLNFSGGGYFKDLDFTGETYFDYGVTFGFGLEYIRNTQALDFALRIGNRDSFIITGGKENYLSFHIGVTTGEKWFLKRRRK